MNHPRILNWTGDRHDDIAIGDAHQHWYAITVRDAARDGIQLSMGQMLVLEAQFEAMLAKVEVIAEEIESDLDCGGK